MDRFLIICGLTATGKTKLGINLAKKFNGEVISADSRQVYRGMDIGTGKDIGNVKCQMSNVKSISNDKLQIRCYEINKVKIWLLDVVEPDYRFNVADYKNCAGTVVEDIQSRGKLPMVVGGTGFYIKAITEEIETIGIEPDWELRERLLHCSITSLLEMLERIDPERSRGMNESDRQNPRRLIRAIEIAQNVKCQMSNVKTECQMSNVDKLFIGLKATNKTLYQRIDQRVEERVRQGIEDEIRGLLKKGYTWEGSALGTTLAYKEWKDYFWGKATREEVIERWKFDEHDYARRQMTWFRKNPEIRWFDITEAELQSKVEKLVKSWYI